MRDLRQHINPITLQICTILTGCLLLFVVTQLSSGSVSHSAGRTSKESDAALAAEEMKSDIGDLQASGEHFSTSQPVILDAITAHDQAITLAGHGGELLRLAPTSETSDIAALATRAQQSLDAFFDTGSKDDLVTFRQTLDALDGLVDPQAAALNAASDSDLADLQTAVGNSHLAILATTLVSTLIVGLITLLLGRRLGRSLSDIRHERDHFLDLTKVAEKRNDQLNALYQVVGEVTDNLNLRYVVSTTVEQASKLVGADCVELRLLEGDSLVPAGRSCGDEGELMVASPLPLGIGLAGRAAKRGKTIRIDDDVESAMAETERIEGTRSGLVVPLIVGARVLGTLSCWSKLPDRFDADDERILEMMASQVASAVAAADLHETSERRASHDALTGLPNRRQLNEDMPELQLSLADGKAMAVVMLDIDNFKRFNDDFGHRVGDVTLQKVAEVMKGSLREADQIYRYGGEEFLVVLPNVERPGATRIMERLRHSVERTLLTGEHLEPVGPVTISGGIALAPEHGIDVDRLIKLADEALYVSKESGRNRLTFAKVEEAEQAAASSLSVSPSR